MLGERFLETAAAAPRVRFVRDLAVHGDNVAVVTDDTTLTYRELARRATDLATELGGTRRLVMVEAENSLGAFLAYLAALAGNHAVMMVAAGDAAARERLLSVYDPDVILWSGPHEPLVDERRPGTRHDLHPDLALLLSTSGSTGSPKLVRLSAANLDANATAIASYLDLRPSDRAITTLPMSYCYGLSVINSHLTRGASVLLQDASVVDAEFWTRVRDEQVTGFAGVPYTFELLDRVGFDAMQLPSLRYVTQAGGRLAPEQVRRYARLGAERGWQFFVMYGQTEATARMAYLPPELAAQHPGAIGVPIPGGRFELAPIPGRTDGAGELVYHGPNVMLGYATAPGDLALGATVDALHTGDIARATDAGLFEIVGRMSRFVKPFGVRTDLDVLERLLRDAGIEALCAGDDHLVAIAVGTGTDVAHVRRLVTDATGLPDRCVHVRAYDTLPRGANAKPDYETIVRDARENGRCAPEPRDVRSVLAAVLNRDTVHDDDSFVSLGGDSLSYVEASMLLETVVGDLPGNWHELSVAELNARRSGRRRMPRIEANIVIRALAIFLVVADHVLWIPFQGGAHVLLAVAGFNYARFSLQPGRQSLARTATNIGRIFVPTAIALAVTLALVDYPGVGKRLFVSAYLDDGIWRYWFIEAMVHILLGLAVLFSFRALRELERRFPFGFPLVLCGILAAVSYAHITFGDPSFPEYETHLIAWMFVLGWLAARANTVAQRAVVTAAAVAVLPWFERGSRGVIVFAGIVLLTWLRHVRLPALVHRALAVVAAASLYVYLVHFEIFRPLLFKIPAPWIVALSFAAGIATWLLVRFVVRTAHRLRSTPVRAPEPAAAGTLT